MKAIIIGAGRGMRLMPNTRELPKCMVEINGTRIIDIQLNALKANGIRDIVFIGGYQGRQIQRAYQAFTYCHNDEWYENNILESLMCASNEFDDNLIVSYSDIVYSADAVNRLIDTHEDFTLMIDRDWQVKYDGRTFHPYSKAEKVCLVNSRIVKIGKHLEPKETHGEFIGLLKMDKNAAQHMKKRYEELREHYADRQFHNASNIKKAYLTDMFQELIHQGAQVHCASITDYWAEVDTVQDLQRVHNDIPEYLLGVECHYIVDGNKCHKIVDKVL